MRAIKPGAADRNANLLAAMARRATASASKGLASLREITRGGGATLKFHLQGMGRTGKCIIATLARNPHEFPWIDLMSVGTGNNPKRMMTPREVAAFLQFDAEFGNQGIDVRTVTGREALLINGMEVELVNDRATPPVKKIAKQLGMGGCVATADAVGLAKRGIPFEPGKDMGIYLDSELYVEPDGAFGIKNGADTVIVGRPDRNAGYGKRANVVMGVNEELLEEIIARDGSLDGWIISATSCSTTVSSNSLLVGIKALAAIGAQTVHGDVFLIHDITSNNSVTTQRRSSDPGYLSAQNRSSMAGSMREGTGAASLVGKIFKTLGLDIPLTVNNTRVQSNGSEVWLTLTADRDVSAEDFKLALAEQIQTDKHGRILAMDYGTPPSAKAKFANRIGAIDYGSIQVTGRQVKFRVVWDNERDEYPRQLLSMMNRAAQLQAEARFPKDVAALEAEASRLRAEVETSLVMEGVHPRAISAVKVSSAATNWEALMREIDLEDGRTPVIEVDVTDIRPAFAASRSVTGGRVAIAVRGISPAHSGALTSQISAEHTQRVGATYAIVEANAQDSASIKHANSQIHRALEADQVPIINLTAASETEVADAVQALFAGVELRINAVDLYGARPDILEQTVVNITPQPGLSAADAEGAAMGAAVNHFGKNIDAEGMLILASSEMEAVFNALEARYGLDIARRVYVTQGAPAIEVTDIAQDVLSDAQGTELALTRMRAIADKLHVGLNVKMNDHRARNEEGMVGPMAKGLTDPNFASPDVAVLYFPTAPFLRDAAAAVPEELKDMLHVGLQAPGPKSDAASWVMVGHTETKMSDEAVANGVVESIKQGLGITVCFEAEHGTRRIRTVWSAIDQAFDPDTARTLKTLIRFVDEPAWAIGTGKTAEAPEMAKAYRELASNLVNEYGIEQEVADAFLANVGYGGSVGGSNVYEFAEVGIGTVLIGGGTLKGHKEGSNRVRIPMARRYVGSLTEAGRQRLALQQQAEG